MLAAAALLTCLAAPAVAQDANPNGGAIAVAGALDFTNAYMFRGIRQESDGLIMQPYLDLGFTTVQRRGIGQDLRSQRRDVEQPARVESNRHRQSAQPQAVVRVRFLHDALVRSERRGDGGDDLHGVHESEWRVRNGEGTRVQDRGR